MIDILLVDDDKLMSQTLADIIELKGYKTEIANSADEALEKIKASKFDCVISDIKMPGTNGIDLFSKINKINPDLPVALMTAYSRDELVQIGLDEGVIGVFSKPLDLKLVFNLLSYIESKIKILIIDDDPVFCNLMSDIFHLLDYHNVLICDFENFEDYIEKDLNGITLVMLDVNLPDSSCSEVFTRLRKKSPNIPIVLVTGYRKEMVDEILTILQNNAAGVLEKPVDQEILFDFINKVKKSEMRSFIYPDQEKEIIKLAQK